jgi:hypothetical protein
MGRSARVVCLLVASAAAPLLSAGCVVHEEIGAEGEIIVTREPPVERAEEPGPTPGTEYIWIRGHWVYGGSDWVWRRGHWEARRAGYAWIAGHWAPRDGGWLWVEGHWRRN